MFTGCPSDNSIDSVPVGSEAYQWINGYSSLGQGESVTFTNSGIVTINNIIRSSPDRVADCRVDGIIRQCQFEVLTLEFTTSAGEESYYITFYLFPQNRLVVNYSEISALEPEILRWDLSNDVLEIPQPNAFSVTNVNDYFHEGARHEAILVETINTETLFASLPPKRFVLLKDYGVIEWEDYDGTTFEVE